MHALLTPLWLRACKRLGLAAGNGFAHDRVRLHVLHPVIVHDPKVALAERVGHGTRHLGFCLDHAVPGDLDVDQLDRVLLRTCGAPDPRYRVVVARGASVGRRGSPSGSACFRYR